MPLIVDTSGTRLGSKDHNENMRHTWDKLTEISQRLAADCYLRMCGNRHEEFYLYYTKTSGKNPGTLVVLSDEESEQTEFDRFILADPFSIGHADVETIQLYIFEKMQWLEILPNEDYSYLKK